MARPTHLQIDPFALRHNVGRVKACCPERKIIAMVKANAYGCGLTHVLPALEDEVDAFGVACLEEAMAVRQLSLRECILFQGVFSPDELHEVATHALQCVVHNAVQLQWILNTPLSRPIRVWVKVNTGMNRLGFRPEHVQDVFAALNHCAWVDNDIGLMTHLACADEPDHEQNQLQLDAFHQIILPNHATITRSVANSAVILSHPEWTHDVVRPGIMLYGVSPFANQEARMFDLKPVMRFVSTVSAIHACPALSRVGYGGAWSSTYATRVGVIPVGYGDGYPRHVAPLTPVWVNGMMVPIIGRVSMDMLAVNLTDCPDVDLGDVVELWGPNLPVETIARAAGTIAYELICQVSPRVRDRTQVISA